MKNELYNTQLCSSHFSQNVSQESLVVRQHQLRASFDTKTEKEREKENWSPSSRVHRNPPKGDKREKKEKK